MYGWTEFDLVQIEQGFKEKRLQQAAMMPKPAPRQPIRFALASTLKLLARHLSPEEIAVPPSTGLAIGAER